MVKCQTKLVATQFSAPKFTVDAKSFANLKNNIINNLHYTSYNTYNISKNYIYNLNITNAKFNIKQLGVKRES